MISQTDILNALVEKVSAKLGDGTTTERLFAQETAFAALVRSAPKRHRRRRAATATLAAAVFVCTLLWILNVFSEDEMRFFIGDQRAPGEIGRWEETKKGGGSVFAFAQGSRIDLREKTTAKVTAADKRKVQVTLRNGVIDTNIEGNGITRWVVDAGPWRVNVMGTYFTVDWRQERGYLQVAVTRGKVRVERADRTFSAVEVSGGELFRAEGDKRVVAPFESAKLPSVPPRFERAKNDSVSDENLSFDREDPTTEGSPEKASPEEEKVSLKAAATRASKNLDTAASDKEGDNRLGWLVHYANGDFEAALTSASRYGIEKLIEQLDAVRLWKLQDAARVTRKYDLSSKILLRFRQRFPKDRNADVAGFLLGRIAMDKGRLSTAARWFNTYIAEAPFGSLAEEAHGLSIIIYEKMGRPDMARQAATAYLNRYKGGAFAKIADAHVGNR